MKKKIALIAAFMMLFCTGCAYFTEPSGTTVIGGADGPTEVYVADTTVATESGSEQVMMPDTNKPASEEDEERLRDTALIFTDALVLGEKQKVQEYLNATDGAVDWMDNVKFTGCEFLDAYVETKTSGDYSYEEPYLLVKFSISESSDERFHAGESVWKLYENDACALVSGLIPVESNVVTSSTADNIKQINLCTRYNYFFGMDFEDGTIESVNDKRGTAINESGDNLRNIVHSTHSITSEEELYAAVEDDFGMTDINWDSARYINSETGEEVQPLYELPARGGCWEYYTIDSYKEADGGVVCTITYYADAAYITPAKTVEYKLTKNDNETMRLASATTVFAGEYEVTFGSV